MTSCVRKFLSSVALGLLFFVVLTPLGFIARLFGRDSLGLKPRATSSYWIERKSSNEAETTVFNRQY
jgi:hypothetical protein